MFSSAVVAVSGVEGPVRPAVGGMVLTRVVAAVLVL